MQIISDNAEISNSFHWKMQYNIYEAICKKYGLDFSWLVPPDCLENNSFITLPNGEIKKGLENIFNGLVTQDGVEENIYQIRDWFKIDNEKIVNPPIATLYSKNHLIHAGTNIIMEREYSVLKH